MKKFYLVIVLLVTALFFSACNLGGGGLKEGNGQIKMFYPGMTNDSGELLRAYATAAQKSGVTLQAQVASTTEYSTLDALITAQDYPDMIQVTGTTDMTTYIANEFLLPLDEYIDEYCPNIKKVLDAHPDFVSQITWKDGHIYHLPTINTDMPSVQKAIVVREDWLNLYRTAASKAANWEPSTPAEYTAMFDWWYANITPVDNTGAPLTGEKVVCYFDRKGGRPEQNLSGLLGVLGSQYFFYYKSDMTVGFAPETPEFKVALEEAAKWWERGYIDTNFFNKSASKSARENYWVNTNKGGLTHDYITGTYTYIEGLNAMSEGANLTTLAPISGQLGTTDAALFVLGGQAITTKAQDTLACLKFLDYLWSEEGQVLTNWGYEGETFEYNQNGDPVLINGWTKDTLREIGVRNPDISGVSNNDIEYEGGMPQNVKDAMEYNKRYLRLFSDCDWFRVEAQNYVTSMDATELQTNLSNIRSALDAYIQGVIMGQKNLTSDYDAFMAQVNGLKLAETKAGCENAFRNLCESYGITADRLK